jgi:hypothetical protein
MMTEMTTSRQVSRREPSRLVQSRDLRAHVITTKPLPNVRLAPGQRPGMISRRPTAGKVALWASLFTAPWVVIVGLLLWQPWWTLGTTAALLALAVGGSARKGGGTWVEVVMRVRVKR